MDHEQFGDFNHDLTAQFTDIISEQLQKKGGGVPTGFVALVQYLDDDGDNCWSFLGMDGQTISASVGMAQVLSRIVDQQLQEALFGDDPQDR